MELKTLNNIKVFSNSQFGTVRTVEVEDEVWFVAKDVAEQLGYGNTRDAINRHVDEDDTILNGVEISDAMGRRQIHRIINESGLYSLILSSKLPTAKQFKHWITSEVIPSIRKHGAYMTPETIEQAILNPDLMIRLCNELKNEQNKNKVLQADNSKLTVDCQIMQPKAEYFDELVDRNLLTNFRDTAKELKVKQNDFVKFLLEKKYVYRDSSGKLLPYSKYADSLFEIKETFNEKTARRGTQTMVTPRGRETFRLLFIN